MPFSFQYMDEFLCNILFVLILFMAVYFPLTSILLKTYESHITLYKFS